MSTEDIMPTYTKIFKDNTHRCKLTFPLSGKEHEFSSKSINLSIYKLLKPTLIKISNGWATEHTNLNKFK